MFPVLRRPPKTMWSRRTPQGPAPPRRQGKVQITFSFLSLHRHRKIRCVPYFSLMLYCAKVYHKKRRENNSRMLLNSRLNIVYFCISIQQSGRNSLQCQPRRAYSGSSARYSPILSSPAAITPAAPGRNLRWACRTPSSKRQSCPHAALQSSA